MAASNPDLPAQMRAMCRLGQVPLAATIPGGVLLAVIMGSTVSLAGRLAWLGVLSLSSIARIGLCRSYLRRERSPAETRAWVRTMLVLTACAGLTWSFAGTLLLPLGVPVRETLTSEVVIGVVAFGFLSLSLVPGLFPAFASAIMLPAAAWQFMHAQWPRPLAGSLYLLFLAVMVLGSIRITRLTRSQIEVTRENEELLARLREERDAAFRINDQLRAASQARSRFLGQVSHELRTPLTVILGYSDLLLRDERERARPKVLEQIRDAGRFLLGIVNDLLDLASAEAGRLKLEMTDFSLPRLLDEVMAELRVNPLARDLRIERHLDPQVPAWVRSDRGRIHQLLLNLGTNALRFTPAGAVEIRLRRVASGDGTLRLRGEVADTGIGLSAEQQARLFQPFTQVGGSASAANGGVGLGLAICRSIVEQMGGSIGVESAPGAGSVFWFELPVRAAGEAAAEFAGGRPAQAALAGSVLVAEDSAPIRELLERFLRDAGCERVVGVASGTDLLQRAAAEEFDLLLVDRQLPGRDGVEAIREIRAGSPSDQTFAHRLAPLIVSSDIRIGLATQPTLFCANPLEHNTALASAHAVHANAPTSPRS